MSNPSKRKGTAWESEVVDFLRANGWPHAERRTLNGAKDRGDVAGIPGVVVECKNARSINLAGWLEEAIRERENDGADVGVVWIKKRGTVRAGGGYVVMDGHTFAELLTDAGYSGAA